MKKKIMLLLTVLLCLPMIVNAKEISLKEFEYGDGNYEYNYAVTETLDNGYIVAGENDNGIYIIKYDHDDKVVWKKYDNSYSYVYDIDIDKDGDFYVVGYTNGDDTVSYDDTVGFIKKYNSKGDLLSQTIVGNDDIEEVYFYDFEINEDKAVAVGECENRIESSQPYGDDGDGRMACAFTFDTSLKLINEHYIDYEEREAYWGVGLTSDGGFVAVGYTDSTNYGDVNHILFNTIPIISKFDKDSKLEWTKVYPLDSRLTRDNSCYYDGFSNGFYDVVETCDGNYAVVGSISYLTETEMPDQLPSSPYNKLIEMLGDNYNSLEIDYDNDEYIYYESAAAILAKYDKNGKLVSEHIENGEFNDVYTDILELDNCDLLVTGNIGHVYDENIKPSSLGTKDEILGVQSRECIYSPTDVKLAIFDEKLKETWSKRYEGNNYDFLNNISPVGPGEFAAVGYFYSDEVGDAKINEESDGLVIRLKITYEINLEETENGKFEAANQHGKTDVVYHGDVATILTTPDEGYKVDTVVVKDSKGNEVPVEKIENGKYEYHITDDTWVTVTFKNVEVVIPPKTGVSTYLLLAVILLSIGFVGYNYINNKIMFKKM